MGLQYDNGKSGNLYALMFGRSRILPQPLQKKVVVGAVQAVDELHLVVSAPQDSLFILSYNLKGFPVPFMSDSASINMFV